MNDPLLAGLALARGEVDRAAERREQPEWLSEAWAGDETLVLDVRGGAVAMHDDGVSPVWHRPDELDSDAAGLRMFLGIAGGRPRFAVAPETMAVAPEGWRNLREIGHRLGDDDAGLLVTAVALANWHTNHQRCPRCGEATEVVSGGWVRKCPADGSLHFPRTDPAVIALVLDGEDRALLGRQVVWPDNFFSTLAGFVEPGESAEAACRREIAEESGVQVDRLVYLGSQPWPFPASIMLGYHAHAVPGATIQVDGTEIAEAHWFSRDELVAACERGTVRLPSRVSIARRLIEHWFGAELPGEWTRR